MFLEEPKKKKKQNSIKLNESFLCIFGCFACPHIPNKQKKKLDDKSQKCIFIGYNDVTKGYKLYNYVTKEVIISKDIQFIEDKAWAWN